MHSEEKGRIMTKKATFEELQQIVRENALGLKELRVSQKELSESQKELSESQKELSESQKETDRQMKETDRQMEKTAHSLKELRELFTGQWGKLMESLVEGDLIKLLNSRNIEVKATSKEHERRLDGKDYEIDIIAINGLEVVAVEVKTTLQLKDINHFIKKLHNFKRAFPEYKDKKIYGAVAYLKANAGSNKYAEKQKLFVIRATGSSASITNASGFKPKEF